NRLPTRHDGPPAFRSTGAGDARNGGAGYRPPRNHLPGTRQASQSTRALPRKVTSADRDVGWSLSRAFAGADREFTGYSENRRGLPADRPVNARGLSGAGIEERRAADRGDGKVDGKPALRIERENRESGQRSGGNRSRKRRASPG